MNFDKRLAIYCAKAIQSLYSGVLPPNVVCAATDTQVRVEKISEGRFVIIIPGTASLHDWRTDGKIYKVASGAGKCHRGFLSAAASVYPEVLQFLTPGAEVIVTGHSLGAAIATIIAGWLTDYHVTNVITFGSPRVGNGAFARGYDDHLGGLTWRICNFGDPIPYLPPLLASTLLQPTGGIYTHVGTECFLNNDSGLDVDNFWAHLAELNSIREQKTTALAQMVLATTHHIAAYIEKLEALA